MISDVAEKSESISVSLISTGNKFLKRKREQIAEERKSAWFGGALIAFLVRRGFILIIASCRALY